MNESTKQINEFTRGEIIANLKKLPPRCTGLFKKIYSFPEPDKKIEDVVRDMNSSRLEWALQQTINSLKIEGIKNE